MIRSRGRILRVHAGLSRHSFRPALAPFADPKGFFDRGIAFRDHSVGRSLIRVMLRFGKHTLTQENG